MSTTLIVKAAGLVTSPNQLNVPDGSLSQADNIIIQRDNVIEPCRGFSLYGDALSSSSYRVKQLVEYRDRILRHYENKIQFDSDGNGGFTELSGTITEPETGIRVKSAESSGNLYLTSDSGIKKISSTSSSDLENSTIGNSGVSKALDLISSIIYSNGLQSGFLPSDSAVAYRVVYNVKDRNNNLLTGTPSQRSVIYNPLKELILQDLLRVLLALDYVTDATDTARVGDGNYFATFDLGITATADEIRTNLIALANKISDDILYADATVNSTIRLTGANNIQNVAGTVTITKAAGNDFDDYLSIGSKVYISGLTTANQDGLNGIQTLTAVTANTIQFTTSEANFAAETIDATVKIASGTYRGLSTPGAVSSPATNTQLLALQTYLDSIILALQEETPVGSLTGIVIGSTPQTAYITPLDITTTSNVTLTITLPDGLTTDHFIQIYRSNIAQATGVSVIEDISPDDEMQLVYEKYITTAEISAKEIVFTDETPEIFKGANLYTNPSSGEGILQSNDKPPFAKDINRFRNTMFYANTRTPYRLNMALLGVQNMITDYGNAIEPSMSIIFADGTYNTYYFVVGVKKVQDITFTADVANSLNGDYIKIYSAGNARTLVLYIKTSGGADTPPTPLTGEELIRVDIPTGETANNVAKKHRDVLNSYPELFIAADNTLPKIRITNYEEGIATSLDDTNAPTFTTTTITEGEGEDASVNKVLLSSVVSPAIAVDTTAKSLIRVINKNSSDKVNAFYLSGTTDAPGKFLLESKDLADNKFYIDTNNSTTGQSFNPDSSPEFSITNINTGTDELTLNTNHGYSDGEMVLISLTDTTPSINGYYQVEVTAANKIKVPVNITVAALSTGIVSSIEYAQSSSNEEKVNRVYYSKYQQPEAVPIVNYFDVGAEDKPIYRIFPLRDTLFVFKQDGLYRVSGESAPFNVQLFDSSVILVADDSVAVSNNLLYAWTTQGILAISESGTSNITRNIDNLILNYFSPKYPNFRTSTWGMGYESDDSYTVFTITETDDTYATQAFRYSTETNTWSRLTRSARCGVIGSDDKMYIGATDTHYIEKERKNWDRTDYADREFTDLIENNKYSSGVIMLSDTDDYDIGDVITQNQTLTVYTFNTFLEQLDLDSGLELSLAGGDPDGYLATYEAAAGDNLRTAVVEIAQVLDTDTGPSVNDFESTIESKSLTINSISVATNTVITTSTAHELFTGRYVTITGSNSTPSINGTWEVTVTGVSTFTIDKQVLGAGTTATAVTTDSNFYDIKACFNKLVSKLNSDTNTSVKTYVDITNDTLQESVITDINRVSRSITVAPSLDYIVGEITIYKALESIISYSPISMGDPVSYKHLREASFLFQSKDFSGFTASFATDLLPQFIPVEMELDGPGLFGMNSFGSGFFGGGSHSAPVRTYIPRNCQRCTYLKIKFVHKVAREFYSLYAVSVTGEISVSTRSYR